jgi:hypothetical protein
MKKQANSSVATFKSAGHTAGLPETEGLINSGLSTMSVSRPIQLGATLRDKVFIRYPMLPGAVFTFQQIVASREWALGGEPDAVYVCLDFLNNAQSKNLETGVVEYGFESFEKRRSVDYQLIGRTAFGLAKRSGKHYLQYIDPIWLTRKSKQRSRSGRISSVPISSPREKIWEYDGKSYATEDVVIQHPLPLGANNYVSPASFLIPDANLAWLLREHNAAALDGRKIRDILMVGGASVKESLTQALETLAKLWSCLILLR